MKKRTIELLGVALGWGAARHEAQEGPQALQKYGIPFAATNLLKPQITYSLVNNLSYDQRLNQISKLCVALALKVKKSVLKKQLPVVLGGDHSMAVGTWSGVIDALAAPQEFGLIWLDAHMDAHTPLTTPSQAIHGMPLAALLGYGEPSLVNCAFAGTKLNPQHLVLIGVRSYEPEEAALLEKLKVKVYFIEEVQQRGFDKVFNEAMNRIDANTKGFGISLDMDVFDPSVAPGTGTPEPNGLHKEEVLSALEGVLHHPKLMALEIAEFDPTKDVQHKTAQVIKELIATVSELQNE